MKVNVDIEFKTVNGKVLKTPSGDVVILKDVMVNALLTPLPNEKVEGVEKLKRWKLSEKIYTSKGELFLSSDEVVLIKKLIGGMDNITVVGQALEILEKSE